MNFSAQECSNGIILVLKMLFSMQALLKSRGAYVDTQNCPEGIIDIIIMFLSSRWLESILGMLTTKNVHFVKLSKCVTDFTIAFLSLRWSKNIYGTSNLGSG
jgi:hypothetical protein